MNMRTAQRTHSLKENRLKEKISQEEILHCFQLYTYPRACWDQVSLTTSSAPLIHTVTEGTARAMTQTVRSDPFSVNTVIGRRVHSGRKGLCVSPSKIFTTEQRNLHVTSEDAGQSMLLNWCLITKHPKCEVCYCWEGKLLGYLRTQCCCFSKYTFRLPLLPQPLLLPLRITHPSPGYNSYCSHGSAAPGECLMQARCCKQRINSRHL